MYPNELKAAFTYHPPKEGQPETYTELRESARAFAEKVQSLAPECREKEIALEKIREAVMWANAGIAIHG